MILKLIGFEDIHSNKKDKDYIMLHYLENINNNVGTGSKGVTDVLLKEVALSYHLDFEKCVGKELNVEYGRNGYVSNITLANN